ncbi:uncharacterized protein TNCV_2818291 [Trichonephila clavipes]|nr:uncharacterized protein TNCV_2818291 [Trichonephila clavipes]
MINTCSAWRRMTVQLPSGSWHPVDLLLQVYECRLRQFVDVCCTMDCVQGCLYTGFPLRQTIDSCVCNGLMNTKPGKLIGTKLSFQTNYASICGTMVTAFVLDALPVDAAFQSALSNGSRVMVWGAISYFGRSNLLRIETNLNSNMYVPKVLQPSFKASLELSYSRIMHAHMFQRLFETLIQPNTYNFLFGLLIHRICRLLCTCGIWLVDVSLVIRVL